MKRLVDRFGRTGFAAITSLMWALPMAAWAGSADLSPVDKTAYPWIALSVGVVMLIVWLALLFRLRNVPVTSRPRRFEVAQMSGAEKRWTLACFAFACGVVAWLNGAATVDWSPLVQAVGSGKAGPTVLAVALLAFPVVMLGGAWASWRKATAAYRARVLTYL
ncbi:MAG TPA: hypothetical protein VJR46_07610 [Candidatus Dormibacteraeota bacterium]|nr:hypothetical protein [Candidatus Dormibacteraeota bacterium]